MTILGVSNSFTGPSLSLEYVEDRCFGYSGVVTLTNSFGDYLNFTTGSKVIVAELLVTGDWDTLGANNIETTVAFNGSTILQDDSSAELTPYVWPITLVIPAYTEVQIQGRIQSGTAEWTCILTGKVLGD